MGDLKRTCIGADDLQYTVKWDQWNILACVCLTSKRDKFDSLFFKCVKHLVTMGAAHLPFDLTAQYQVEGIYSLSLQAWRKITEINYSLGLFVLQAECLHILLAFLH